MSEPVKCESFQVSGEQLLSRVRELLHEGSVRRIRIHHAGHTVLELPLTVGVLNRIDELADRAEGERPGGRFCGQMQDGSQFVHPSPMLVPGKNGSIRTRLPVRR